MCAQVGDTCTSNHPGLHCAVEAYIEAQGWIIFPSFQGMLTATNVTGECALVPLGPICGQMSIIMWEPLCTLFCLKNLMRSLGLEMARWMVVSAPWWRGLYLGHSFLNRIFFCGNKKILNFTPSWDEGSCTLKGNLASKIQIWNHFIFKCNVNSCQIRLNNFIYEPNTLPCVYYITQCY